MNCQEVQLQLSGYLEKGLDAIRMKGIETHLSSCPFCRAELHGLADCIRQVAELSVVEPPIGFTQRVMAHAREIEIEPSAWRRLLGAFRSTMPIQAAAMVLIGVLAVLIYQKEPAKNLAFTDKPLDELPALPSQQLTNSFLGDSLTPMASAPARLPNTDREPTAAAKSAPQPVNPSVPQSVVARSRAAETKDQPAIAESPAAAAKSESPEKALEGRLAAPRRPTIQAQEVSTGSEARRSSADALSIGAAVGALNRAPFRGTPYSAERALSPLSEPTPDFEFVVRRRPRERVEHKEGISGVALNRLEAELPAAREPMSPPVSSMVEIRWFTVRPEHYEYFRKDLAAEANIESEKTTGTREKDAALKSSQELLIKVLILQPER